MPTMTITVEANSRTSLEQSLYGELNDLFLEWERPDIYMFVDHRDDDGYTGTLLFADVHETWTEDYDGLVWTSMDSRRFGSAEICRA